MIGALFRLEGSLLKVLRELKTQQEEQFEELKGWGSFGNPYFVVVEDPILRWRLPGTGSGPRVNPDRAG